LKTINRRRKVFWYLEGKWRIDPNEAKYAD
jgi:hypothetical protein